MRIEVNTCWDLVDVIRCISICTFALLLRTDREDSGGSWDQRGWGEGEYTLFIRYVLNESHSMASTKAVIYLPRLVKTGRQVDCHCPSIVLSYLAYTNYITVTYTIKLVMPRMMQIMSFKLKFQVFR